MASRSIPVVGVLLALLGIAGTAGAEVAPTTLGRLAAQADAVLVGRVTATRTVEVEMKPDTWRTISPKALLAKVVVEQWIVGQPRLEELWIWATPTWVDDTTTAAVGERVLWFLDERGVDDLVKPASERVIRKATGGASVWRVVWEGRGRMPLRTVGERDYASVWVTDVVVPSEFHTIPGADPRYPGIVRGVALADLLCFIRRVTGPVPAKTDDHVGRLLAAFASADEDATARAYDEFKRMGEFARPLLMKVLADQRSPYREVAAELLKALDETGERALLRSLGSANVRVRRVGAFTAEWISRQNHIWHELLLARLKEHVADPDAEVRWRALQALVNDDAPEPEWMLPALAAALADASFPVRIHAARSVAVMWSGWIDDESNKETVLRMEKALLGWADAGDLTARRAAWEALSRVCGPASWEATRMAVAEADPVVRVCATQALGRIATPASIRLRVALLKDQDARVRRAAAFALGVKGLGDAVDPLVAALRDGDAHTRRLAAWALGKIGGTAAKAVPVLEGLMKSTKDDALQAEIGEALEAIRQRERGER